LRVIDAHHRIPRRRVVTGIAGVAGGDMVGRFTGGGDAVVTTRTRARRHAAVIKRRAGPGRGAMTGAALLRGRDVIGGLTGGDRAVVTTRTGALHLRVIHFHHRIPGGGVVA